MIEDQRRAEAGESKGLQLGSSTCLWEPPGSNIASRGKQVPGSLVAVKSSRPYSEGEVLGFNLEPGGDTKSLSK